MTFPGTHESWMCVYFGLFGSTAAVLVTMVAWYWVKLHAKATGAPRSAWLWTMIGYAFLFSGAWFACGIGRPPGNMLSSDPTAQDLEMATGAAVLSMFVSVPGWACVLMGMRRWRQGEEAAKSDGDQ